MKKRKVEREAKEKLEKLLAPIKEESKEFYDVIIIDLPDPRTIELAKLYSLEFYHLCKYRLKTNGFIITQSGSPYYASRAFKTINKNMLETVFT